MNDKYDEIRQALAEPISPLPWTWWTSNSHNRLSSDPTMRDGDVLSAVRATDGLPIVNSKKYDRELIVAAVNNVAELLAERDAMAAAIREHNEKCQKRCADEFDIYCGNMYQHNMRCVGCAMAEWRISTPIGDSK